MVKSISNSTPSKIPAQSNSHASQRIRSGDTLSQIAKKHGLSLKDVLEANPQIKNPDRIRVGQEIFLPQPTQNSAKTSKPANQSLKQKSQLESQSERSQRQQQQQSLAQKETAIPQVKTGELPQKNGALGLLQSKKELLQGLGKASPSQAATTNPKKNHSLAPVNAKLLSQLGDLEPKNLKGVDPLQMLGAVNEGHLKVDIPLKAGHYKIKGVNVTIPKGSVLKLQAQVHNGQLLAAEDKHGHKTGGGCKVEVDPPLDLPLWIDGKGAYLKDKGQARAQLNADLSGWFDQSIGDSFSTDLKTLVKGLGDGSATPQSRHSRSGNKANAPMLPSGLLRLPDMKFDVGQVKMKSGQIDMGNARLDLAPGNSFNIKGNSQSSELSGQVKLRGLSMQQDGSTMRMGASNADLTVRMQKGRDGLLHSKTSLSNIKGELQGFDKRVTHKDGRVDHIALGKTQLRNGRFDMSSVIKTGKNGGPEIQNEKFSGRLKAKGQIKNLQMQIPDDKGGAEVKLGSGTFDGQLSFGPAGSKVDIDIKNNNLHINDLQSHDQGARLDLSQADMQGSGHFNYDGGQQKFSVDLDAKNLNLQLKDYRGANDDTLVDLGQSRVQGRGQLHFGNKTGLQVDGDMQIKSTIDDLKINKADAQAVDLAAGSTINAKLQHLSLGGQQPFELKAKGAVDLGLENFKTTMPGLDAQGQARLSGNGQLNIGQGQMFLTEADATVRVRVDDAKIAGGKDLSLDVAAGSNMDLKIKEFKRSKITADNSIKLGQGSELNAVLDSGQIRVGTNNINLQAGSVAQFKLDGLVQKDGQPPELQGRLSLDAKVAPDLAKKLDSGKNIKITEMNGAEGRIHLDIDDVKMQQNGHFELKGLDLQMDAKADRISANVAAPTGKGTIDTSGQKPLQPLRPIAASAAVQSPDGTLSSEDVQKMSAASIAGANIVGHDFHPAQALKGLKNGTLKLSVPVEGKLGKGWLGSADFPKGTKLDLQFKVKDGKIVPDKTKAKFSKSGDAALWTTVNGAYFDKDNTLRLDLGGMYDFAVPGMEKMPLDLDKALDRLMPKDTSTTSHAETSNTDLASQLNAFKIDQAQISVSTAEFKAGPLQLPGGQVILKEGSRLSVSGSGRDLKIQGQVDFSSMQMASDGVAIKSDAGRAKLKLHYQNKDGKGQLSSSLDDVNLKLQYAVHKRENGDYIHLADGQVENASFSSRSTMKINAQGLPSEMGGSKVNLDIPSFNGQVEGARVSVDDADGEAQIELGSSTVQGEIHVVNNKISMRGHFNELDAAVYDLAMGSKKTNTQTSVDLSSARVHGQGDINYAQGQGLTLDAKVQDSDLRLRDAKVEGQGLNLDIGATRLTGSGHIHLNSGGNIDVTGQLRLDSQLDASTVQGSPLGVEGDLALAQDSRISADIHVFHMGSDGSFNVTGEGGVDLEVEGFKGELPGLSAEGHATIRGGGAFSIDSEQGMKFPDRFSVGVDLADAKINSPDGSLQLDLAAGSRLQAEVNTAKIDGDDSQIVLGKGSRLSGALDGGVIHIPGIDQPINIKAGSMIDLQIDRFDTVGKELRQADGQLFLDAIIDQDQLDLSRIRGLKNISLEKIAGGQVRLKLNVGRAHLDDRGHLQLLDSNLSLGASIDHITGQYRPKDD